MTSKPARSGPGPQAAGSQAEGSSGWGERVRDADVRWATSGYLGAIILGPLIPVVVYVIRRRRSPFMRYHAATALNLSLTGLLYGLCCLILGGLLLLDSVIVALAVALPLAFALWVCMLTYLIRGVRAANRGEQHEVPDWVCAQIAK
jgi:uncharacterized Tic20 family protein